MCKAVTLSLAVLCSLAGPSLLAAQHLEVTPFVGLYAPTASVIKESAGGITVGAKHGTAFLFGGRFTYWTSPTVGIEGSLGYTSSGVDFTVDTGAVTLGTVSLSAHVLLGSARVLFKVGPNGGNTDFHLLAGVGVISHGGDAYDQLGQGNGGVSGKTDIGGVVGGSVRFKASQKLKVSIDVEDNLYSAKFSIGGSESTSHFQNDLAVSIGLVIPL